MKLYKFLLLSSILALILPACEKETTDNISKVVKVSYPEVTINGAALVVLSVGSTFTDPGAKVKDDITGQTTDLKASSGAVNSAKPGLYVLQYTASNANGFESVAHRTVAVTSVNNKDYSGTYLRPATGVKVYITKEANGVYKVQNPGGAATGTDVVVYFVEIEPDKFIAPPQPSSAGLLEVTEIKFELPNASWKVLNATYGTGLRTFIKE